jgi:hypothetical protein
LARVARGIARGVRTASVVEHAHRGTIGQVAREELVLAAIEKNRALFEWKHLDTPELVREHLTRCCARRTTPTSATGASR